MARLRLIERRLSRFLNEPVSVRNAAGVIAGSTIVVVITSGVLMRLVDRSEYPTIGRGLWWAMQTVTTVGYGDVTPENTSGRIVAVFVMLWGIAFVAIIVAAITSTFVTRAEREHEQADPRSPNATEDRLEAGIEELADRLDRMEQALARIEKPEGPQRA